MDLKARSFFLLGLLAAFFCTSCNRANNGSGQGGSPAGQASSGADQPDPKQLLQQMADYLGELPKFSCQVTTAIEMKAAGLDNRQESKSEFRLQRPDQFALISESEMNGLTMVSDGETLVQYIPMLSRMSSQEAPANIDEIMSEDSPIAMMLMGPGVATVPYGGPEFYRRMIAGVTDSKYLGTETIDGSECHHCEFRRDKIIWQIWIESGDRPLPRKLSFDLSEQMAGGGAMFENATITSFVNYESWNTNPDFTEADFQFEAPEGTTEVDDLLGSLMSGDGRGGQAESIHPLLGQKAPVFQADGLREKNLDMEEYFGKEVVILDFWATWCGPCVAAMPEIAAVAEQYADQGVRLFAVNVGEEPGEIESFLESENLNVNVLLDPNGEISSSYRATAIPQTVLIGKSGIVEVVHVGMSGDLREKLAGELDKLLAGEKLAETTLAEAEKKKAERQQAVEAQSFGTAPVWNLPGDYSGVAVDEESSTVYAIGPLGELTSVTADGTAGEPVETAQGGTIRLADLAEGGKPEILTFGSWGQRVQAMDASGEPLWDYTLGQGIDDVGAADLDGNGRDEVIIGYNGGTGLHVLDQQGLLLWKFTDIGNVWHVTAGDFDGSGKSEVITTSAQGVVHVFDREGKKIKDIKVPIYANMVRMLPPRDAQPPQVVVTGSGDDGETLVTIDIDGNVGMRLNLPIAGTAHVDDLSASTTAAWAAVAMRGGLVHVVDLDKAAIVASVAGQGGQPSVAWCPRDGKTPLLVVATGGELNAFEVAPED